MTPPPRLVPDRPSDAAIAQAFWELRNASGIWIYPTSSSELVAQIRNRASAIDSASPPRPSLTEQLQQKCSDWGTYWRAPDAHGVILSTEQALELLRDALGVEVEIDAAAPPAEAPAERVEAALHLDELRDLRDTYVKCPATGSRKVRALDAAIALLAAAPAAPAPVATFTVTGRGPCAPDFDMEWLADYRTFTDKGPIPLYTAPRVTGGREDSMRELIAADLEYDAAEVAWDALDTRDGLGDYQDPRDYDGPEYARVCQSISRRAKALQAANGGEGGNG